MPGNGTISPCCGGKPAVTERHDPIVAEQQVANEHAYTEGTIETPHTAGTVDAKVAHETAMVVAV